MKKILTIVGTRPQIIKSAAITRAIQTQFSEQLQQIVIDTGQHFDKNMSANFYGELGIPLPKANLNNHSLSATLMVEKIRKAVIKEDVDAVLVYGDTTSTLAGSIYAAMSSLPLFHVEAGLRSYNFEMPEEWNRVLTDGCSDLLFAPTELALDNLKNKSFEYGLASCTGDVMFDNCKYFGDHVLNDALSALNLADGNYVFFTCHRASNTDDALVLKAIIECIKDLSKQYKVFWPMHPRTKARINTFFGEAFYDELNQFNIDIVEPLSYVKTVALIKDCLVVATDSGGVQKESYFLRKKSIVFRQETEWEEIVNDGAAVLFNPICDNIVTTLANLRQQKVTFKNHYGDGNAAQKICEQMVSFFDL